MNEFTKYCKTGNIDDIKCMSLKQYDIDEGFRIACQYGHYMIVKYLVELYKTGNPNNDITDVNYYDKINISSHGDYGFIWACYMGYYNIVLYLIELYKNDKNYEEINIHSWDEEGFRLAYKWENYMIVKYLMTLYKKHKYTYKPINNYLIIFHKFNKYKL